MQQVLLSIKNEKLEKRLLEEAGKKGRKVASIILEVLEKNFLQEKEPQLRYKTLDPYKHMTKIDYDVDEDDDFSDVMPFKDVKDSAAYVKDLRKTAWRT